MRIPGKMNNESCNNCSVTSFVIFARSPDSYRNRRYFNKLCLASRLLFSQNLIFQLTQHINIGTHHIAVYAYE